MPEPEPFSMERSMWSQFDGNTPGVYCVYVGAAAAAGVVGPAKLPRNPPPPAAAGATAGAAAPPPPPPHNLTSREFWESRFTCRMPVAACLTFFEVAEDPNRTSNRVPCEQDRIKPGVAVRTRCIPAGCMVEQLRGGEGECDGEQLRGGEDEGDGEQL